MQRGCMMWDYVLSLIQPSSPMPALITFDTNFLNQIAFPPPHAGIIVLRSIPRDTTVNELASTVLKAASQ
jgi:hypothetical protein